MVYIFIEQWLINNEEKKMSPRKSVDKELSREMILDVARILFVKDGYEHVSMRKIAKELGYSHGALYYHFKNKAELFYALVADGFLLLNQRLEEVMEKELSKEDKLKEVFLAYIHFGMTNPSHYETMFLTKDQELKSFLQEEPNNSFEKFAQAVHSLVNINITPKDIYSIFLSLHGFVTHFIFKGQKYEDNKALAESHIQLILRSIQS